jgi:hypothetical protein
MLLPLSYYSVFVEGFAQVPGLLKVIVDRK